MFRSEQLVWADPNMVGGKGLAKYNADQLERIEMK